LAEAFGIYTALSFLLHYTQLYPLTIHNTQPISIHCNNLGVIEQISNTTSIQYPRDAIHDNYPIFREIETQIQQLYPIIPKFYHVMVHHDTKSDRPLMLLETLNVDCDQ